MVNIDPEVAAQIYKSASISLCSNVEGQLMVGLMCNPPKAGDASHAQLRSRSYCVLHHFSAFPSLSIYLSFALSHSRVSSFLLLLRSLARHSVDARAQIRCRARRHALVAAAARAEAGDRDGAAAGRHVPADRRRALPLPADCAAAQGGRRGRRAQKAAGRHVRFFIFRLAQ